MTLLEPQRFTFFGLSVFGLARTGGRRPSTGPAPSRVVAVVEAGEQRGPCPPPVRGALSK